MKIGVAYKSVFDLQNTLCMGAWSNSCFLLASPSMKIIQHFVARSPKRSLK